jgi:predicted dienelactone hydrolase
MNRSIFLFFNIIFSFSMKTFADNTFKTGVQIIEFQDARRDNRIVPIQLFYPVNVNIKTEPITKGIAIRKEIVRNAPISTQFKNCPLILYSHGHAGSSSDIAWLADVLVPKGYIIASVEHFGNAYMNEQIDYSLSRFWERPLDVSFVLTKLLEHPEWKEKIDPSKIVAGGFSKGGMTTTFLAGGQMEGPRLKTFVDTYFYDKDETAPYALKKIEAINWSLVEKNYRDPRIKAFITFAPAFGHQFTDKSLSAITLPFLIIVGENDRLMPIEANAQYLKQHIKSAQYHLLNGKVGHFVFMNQCNEAGFIFAEGVCRDDPSVNRGVTHQKIADLVDTFLKTSLK